MKAPNFAQVIIELRNEPVDPAPLVKLYNSIMVTHPDELNSARVSRLDYLDYSFVAFVTMINHWLLAVKAASFTIDDIQSLNATGSTDGARITTALNKKFSEVFSQKEFLAGTGYGNALCEKLGLDANEVLAKIFPEIQIVNSNATRFNILHVLDHYNNLLSTLNIQQNSTAPIFYDEPQAVSVVYGPHLIHALFINAQASQDIMRVLLRDYYQYISPKGVAALSDTLEVMPAFLETLEQSRDSYARYLAKFKADIMQTPIAR